jgi:molybdate transport system substrate-binding protein
LPVSSALPDGDTIVTRRTLPRTFAAAIAFVSCSIVGGQGAAHADEIRVLSANVFTGVLDELVSGFERTSGHKVTVVFGTAGTIRNRVQTGEFADVTILPRPMLDELLRQGKITAGSIIDLAHSAVGVAVRSGTSKPDIGTVVAFRRALLAAASISYADPTRGGATGVLVTRVLDRLGASEDVKPKTKFPPPGRFAVELVANGEAEIALAQPMEVLAQPGVELVGLMPTELQDPANFTFSAGIIAVAKEIKAARTLIQFLSGPTAAAVLKAKGMAPG